MKIFYGVLLLAALTGFGFSSTDFDQDTLPTLEETHQWLIRVKGEYYDDEEDIYALEKLPELTQLYIGNKCVIDADLRFIAPLKKLQELTVSNGDCDNNGFIKGPGLKWLSGLTDLESIDFDWNDIDPKYFYHLKNLSKLSEIRLLFNNLGEKSMRGLIFLKSLETVRLNGNEIDEAAAQSLSILQYHPTLKTLDIGGNPLNGSALQALKHLKIKQLDLTSGTDLMIQPVIDALGVDAIRSMQNLRWLDIRGLTLSGKLLLNLYDSQLEYIAHDFEEFSLEDRIEMVKRANPRLFMELSPAIITGLEEAGLLAAFRSALEERTGLSLQLNGFDDPEQPEAFETLLALCEDLPIDTIYISKRFYDATEVMYYLNHLNGLIAGADTIVLKNGGIFSGPNSETEIDEVEKKYNVTLTSIKAYTDNL